MNTIESTAADNDKFRSAVTHAIVCEMANRNES